MKNDLHFPKSREGEKARRRFASSPLPRFSPLVLFCVLCHFVARA